MPPLPFHPRWLLLLLLLPAAGLATCGSGDGDTFRTDRPVLRLTVDEYRIAPQDVEIELPAGGRVKFVVRNAGRLTHNLVVELPPAGPGEQPDEPLIQTETMQPGQIAPPVKLALRPGTYRLRCTIANHDDLGQYGELRVVAADG